MTHFIRFCFLSFAVCGFIFCSLSITSCGEEAVKLNGNDRVAIDTLSANAIAKLMPELDKKCRDSSDALRKQLVDSLVIVREREILMQTLPPNH